MSLDTSKKSSRFLQGRRYTHDTFTDSQESFTSVLDINASEIYIDQDLIPSSGLPYNSLGDHLSVYSVGGQDVIKYYYRQRMTKSDLNNEVWFFVLPTGSTSGIGAQLIDTNQQTNFISPKYSIPSLSNANTEDATPGYLAKVFIENTQVSVNNYQFDYKTGVLQFTSSGVAPTSGQSVYISVYQYVGRTLSSQVGSGGDIYDIFKPTGSFFATTNDLQVTGSMTIKGDLRVEGTTTLVQTVDENIESLIVSGAMSIVRNELTPQIVSASLSIQNLGTLADRSSLQEIDCGDGFF